MSEKKIPRPRNAFILFRQHHHRLLIEEWTSQGVDIPHNSKISKILGTRWRALGVAERSHWEQLARQEKCEHEKKYPDYRYKPIRRHKRRGSRVEEEQQNAAAAVVLPVAAAAPRALLQQQQQQQQQQGLPAFPPPARGLAAPATFATRAGALGPPRPELGAPYHHHQQQHPYYVPMQSYLPRISSAVPTVPTVPPAGVLPSVYAPVPSTPSVQGTPGTNWHWQPRYCYPFDQRGHR